MIIQTERLMLRPFVETDVKWYYDFLQDKELQKRLPSLAVENIKQAQEDVRLFKNGDFVNDFYYVIETKAHDIIGIIIAVRITDMAIDVSYFLKEQYRHKGYMHEALATVANSTRNINPLYRLRLVIEVDNIASLNVAKRLNATIKERNGKYICYI
jgi:RimJ/RimL family protein N-acetyltransferase